MMVKYVICLTGIIRKKRTSQRVHYMKRVTTVGILIVKRKVPGVIQSIHCLYGNTVMCPSVQVGTISSLSLSLFSLLLSLFLFLSHSLFLSYSFSSLACSPSPSPSPLLSLLSTLSHTMSTRQGRVFSLKLLGSIHDEAWSLVLEVVVKLFSVILKTVL